MNLNNAITQCQRASELQEIINTLLTSPPYQGLPLNLSWDELLFELEWEVWDDHVEPAYKSALIDTLKQAIEKWAELNK